MARIQISFPNTGAFSVDLPVRITDMNYGGHMGNDRFLAFVQEARHAFFAFLQCTELDIGDGIGSILADSAVVYKREVFAGAVLCVEVAPAELGKFGFELRYRMTDVETGAEVALAKTGIVCFNYASKRLAPMPDGFRQQLAAQL